MKTKFVLVAAFLLTQSAFSQSHPKPASMPRAAQSQTAAKYDLAPFDDSAKQLKPSYRGHDLFEVMKKIKLPPTKGEFEKTEEFEARLAKWQSSTIVGTVTYADLLAFELVQGLSPDSLKVEYDADAEEFKVKVNFENHTFSSNRERWLETFYTSKNLGSRNAVTRMGIKFRVTSHTGTSVGIAIPQSVEAIEIKVKGSRDQAIAMKSAIRAFAVVKLFEPYKILENTSSTASLDSPDEWYNAYLGVSATLESLIIVDIRSGEILSRINAPFPTCSYNIC